MVPAAYLAATAADPLGWMAGLVLALLPAAVVGSSLVHWLVTLTRAAARASQAGLRGRYPTGV